MPERGYCLRGKLLEVTIIGSVLCGLTLLFVRPVVLSAQTATPPTTCMTNQKAIVTQIHRGPAGRPGASGEA